MQCEDKLADHAPVWGAVQTHLPALLMSTAAFFAERKGRADLKAFGRLLNRKGGQTPRSGDERWASNPAARLNVRRACARSSNGRSSRHCRSGRPGRAAGCETRTRPCAACCRALGFRPRLPDISDGADLDLAAVGARIPLDALFKGMNSS